MVEFDQTQALTDMGFTSVAEMQEYFGLEAKGKWGSAETIAYSDYLIAKAAEEREQIKKNYSSAVRSRRSAERSLDKVVVQIEDLNKKINDGYDKVSEGDADDGVNRSLKKFVRDLAKREKELIPKSKAYVDACRHELYTLQVQQEYETSEANLRIDESFSRLESARIHLGLNDEQSPEEQAKFNIKVGLKMWADQFRAKMPSSV